MSDAFIVAVTPSLVILNEVKDPAQGVELSESSSANRRASVRSFAFAQDDNACTARTTQ